MRRQHWAIVASQSHVEGDRVDEADVDGTGGQDVAFAELPDNAPPRHRPSEFFALTHFSLTAKSMGVAKESKPILPATYDAELSKIMAESARLKRQSAGIRKRIAELDEQIAARLPLIGGKPTPRRKP